MIDTMKIDDIHIDPKTVFIALGIVQISYKLVFYGQKLVLTFQLTFET